MLLLFIVIVFYESQLVGVAELLFASAARIGGLGVVGAKQDQNLEMVGGEFVQGSNFPLHVPCRNWVTVGHRFPPGPFFGGWFVGGCCVGDGWGRCSQAGQVLSGTSFSGVGDGGAGVGSTPAGQESQGRIASSG